jgi:hypothetical protein
MGDFLRQPSCRRLPKHWCFILILLALGCVKPRIAYQVDAAFQSSSYRTMAPDPRKDRIVIREGMAPLNPELHLQAVLTELASRNYRPAPASEADLWVAVYVLMGNPAGGKDRSVSSSHREGAGEGPRGGKRSSPGTGGASTAARAGGARGTFTIIVQLEDRKTDVTVWQGEANLDPNEKTPDGRPLSLEEVVHQLLQPLNALP